MEVTPEGTFARDENGNLVLIFGVPRPEDPVRILEAIQQEESEDRASVVSFLTQDVQGLLQRWTDAGAPDWYMVASLVLYPPPKCSDGVERNMQDYITFLTERSTQDWFIDINANVSGSKLAPSVQLGSIQIWVYKC